MMNLDFIEEPTIDFGYGQSLEDPRDGLTLFGPLDKGKPYGIRAGVIGTDDGIQRFQNWVRKLNFPIRTSTGATHHPDFPGFETVFGIPWSETPTVTIPVAKTELDQILRIGDGHIRTFRAVDMYVNHIIEATRDEDTSVDIWFIVIPEEVHRYCRPNSHVPSDIRIASEDRLSANLAKKLRAQPTFFAEDQIRVEPYRYDVHFRDQLKARVLHNPVPIQVVRETTLAREDFVDRRGQPSRQLEPESAVAWNLSTATFYKAGGRPWKLSAVRPGVCYVGIAFKMDFKVVDGHTACCAAQMFLDSGDGIVFKGAVGPWYNPDRGNFHLSREAASTLMHMAVASYKRKMGVPPSQIFIHGKVRFASDEWDGFVQGAGQCTELIGVYMKRNHDFKLFRNSDYPVLRGMAHIRDDKSGYLWTIGFIPRLATYPGWDVPWPLYVEVTKGQCDIEVVLRDVLALTKLNYNTCIFGDGLPVTLKFADAVGNVLTAGPATEVPPLAFRYYI